MHRVDAPGATIDNLFTEGNPTLGIPATQVSDNWLNDVQENLALFIESVGIALVKDDFTQLTSAIGLAIGEGGTQTKIDPLLNATANQSVVTFPKATVKGAALFYDVHRQTDSSNEQESGIVMVNHDEKDDVWRLTELINGLDNAGVTFNVVVATGEVRVSTDDLTGTNYDGQLRLTGVIRFTQ